MTDLAIWIIRSLAVLSYARAAWLLNKWAKNPDAFIFMEIVCCFICFAGFLWALRMG